MPNKTHSINVEKPTKRSYAGLAAPERQQMRKDQLIQAGLEAFGTHGYGKTSIKAVCQLANLTERYFYESFTNKEALLIAVYHYLTDQLKDNFAEILANPAFNSQEKVHQSLEMLYRRYRDDPYRARIQFFEILGVSENVNRVYQQAMKDLQHYILMLFNTRYPKAKLGNINPNIMATAISGAIIQVGVDWALNDFEQPLEEILPTLLQAFESMGSVLSGTATDLDSHSLL